MNLPIATESVFKTAVLSENDLLRYHGELSCSVGNHDERLLSTEKITTTRTLSSPCAKCPFRVKPKLSAPPRQSYYSHENSWDKLATKVMKSGGFPCHCAEGNLSAFHPETPTQVVCAGWREAGGGLDPLRKLFLPDL